MVAAPAVRSGDHRLAAQGGVDPPQTRVHAAPCEDGRMNREDMERRVRALAPASLRGLRRGIEKEGLRVRPDGTLASTPHPAGLGSALTHPRITTDFSEAQLELITGVHAG